MSPGVFPHRHLRSLAPLALASAILAVGLPEPVHARESLGLYGTWGAFRDPLIPRCYAIAMAEPSAMARDYQAFAAVGTWPRRGARGQVHLRLSRQIAPNATITLRVGERKLVLSGGGGDAWPVNETDNAAILAAMRSARTMTVSARDRKGRPFSNRYTLAGAASAMDAALLGCARVR